MTTFRWIRSALRGRAARRIDASTASDVVNAYRVLLGRTPESEGAVAAKLAMPPSLLLKEIASSVEFRDSVLQPLLRGPSGAAPRFNEAAPVEPVRWIGAVLSLAAPDELTRAKTWGSLLATLLQTPEFLAAAEIEAPTVSSHAGLDAWLVWTDSSVVGGLDRIEPETIGGWIVDAADPDRHVVAQVYVEGVFAGAGAPDNFRRDLQDAYGGAGRFGFSIPLQLDFSRLGRRPLTIELREAATQKRIAVGEMVLERQVQLDSLRVIAAALANVRAQLEEVERRLPAAAVASSFSLRSYDAFHRAFYAPLPSDVARQRSAAETWSFPARFGVALDDRYGSDADRRRTVESLKAQSYPGWLVLQDKRLRGAPARGSAPAAVTALPEASDRINYVFELICGDVLVPDALFRLGSALQGADRPLVLYADEDETGRDGTVHSPRLRTGFDPILLLQEEDAGALLVVEAEKARREGVFDIGGDPEQRHRYALATLLGTKRSDIRHIARVLCHRGRPQESREATLEARARIVAHHRPAGASPMRVAEATDALGAPLGRAIQIRPAARPAESATVIIATRDRVELLRPCVETLLETRSRNLTPFDLLIVDNGSTTPEACDYLLSLDQRAGIRVLRDDRPFNWAQLNNAAAAEASGEMLIFLNNDTLPITRDWCDELCFWAAWPGVGVVGARLVYGDGTLQHAGVALGAWGTAAHEGVGDPGTEPGYLRRHALTRLAGAVTGACMAVRRDVFQSLQGFDADRFAVNYNDVDFCLRARAAGLDVVYAAQAVFHHYESKSRSFDANLPPRERQKRQEEGERLRAKWGAALGSDPLYNAHFERLAPPFSTLRGPER